MEQLEFILFTRNGIFRGQSPEKHCLDLHLTVSEVCEMCVFVFVWSAIAQEKAGEMTLITWVSRQDLVTPDLSFVNKPT